uniref:palmitoyl-protein hydrolase n=1 Tax=Astyanax mexicanus TaxID=7994 RepID=A0A8B9JR87_ASTMX
MAAVQKLRRCAVSQTGKHSASVIFLHGSGDTGQGLRAWVRDVMTQDMAFEHIRVIYPTAPSRPYTPMHGALSHVWFDRHKISRDCPEHLESIEEMCSNLGAIVQDEIRAGVPKHRMVIGGFSMGGAMALHLACRYHQDIAGVFALSSFLNKDSVVYQLCMKECYVGAASSSRFSPSQLSLLHCLAASHTLPRLLAPPHPSLSPSLSTPLTLPSFLLLRSWGQIGVQAFL